MIGGGKGPNPLLGADRAVLSDWDPAARKHRGSRINAARSKFWDASAPRYTTWLQLVVDEYFLALLGQRWQQGNNNENRRNEQ